MAIDPMRVTPGACFETASGEKRKVIKITDSDTVVYVKQEKGAEERWVKTKHCPARMSFSFLVEREIDCPNYR
jgi:hypothetical protein